MNGLDYALISGIVTLSLLNWWSACCGKRRTFVITKPLVMIFLITLFVKLGGVKQEYLWFLFGLLASLAGDILLLYPARWFIHGLVGFFFAQVFYIIGFNIDLPPLLPSLIVGCLIVLLLCLIFRILQREIPKNPNLQKMRFSILIYAAVLSTMTASTALSLFKPSWPILAAAIVSLGGFLFLSSDMILAYDRFVKRLGFAHPLVMSTYHLAQFAIVAGVLLKISQY